VATTVAERAWSVVVPHHPRAAGQARSRMSAELSTTIQPELLADAVSIIAELVGNAIRHARPLPGNVVRIAWSISVERGVEIIEIRVTDGGAATIPAIPRPDPEAIDGRGLTIVAALASSWGCDRDGLGHSVWAQVSLPAR
jgi:anti-sigma regulatory factor (Ser/Thr protein kinase)